MKLTVDTKQIKRTLGLVKRSISKRPTMPALAGVEITADSNRVSMRGTDMDRWTTCYFDGKTEPIGEQSVVVDAKKLESSLKGLNGAITLETDDEKLNVNNGIGSVSLDTIPSEEFPELPEFADSELFVELHTDQLSDMLNATKHAMHTDITRLALTHVCLTRHEGRLSAVATDCKRLSLYQTNITEFGEGDILLNKQQVDELAKLCKEYRGSLRISRVRRATFVIFAFTGATYTTRVSSDKFPGFADVLPDASEMDSVKVLKSDMLPVLEQCKGQGSIDLSFQPPGRIVITTTGEVWSPDQKEPVMNMRFELTASCTTNKTIRIRPLYLHDAVEAMIENTLAIYYEDRLSPVLVRPIMPEGNDQTCLVMPVRIKG